MWTDDSLPDLTNGRQFEATTELSGKAHILRYELLHKYGGIYIDANSKCLNSLDFVNDLITLGNALRGASRSEEATKEHEYALGVDPANLVPDLTAVPLSEIWAISTMRCSLIWMSSKPTQTTRLRI